MMVRTIAAFKQVFLMRCSLIVNHLLDDKRVMHAHCFLCGYATVKADTSVVHSERGGFQISSIGALSKSYTKCHFSRKLHRVRVPTEGHPVSDSFTLS